MSDIVWGIGAIVLTIVVAMLAPLGLVILVPVLLAGGISARRRSQDVATIAIANGAIAGGIAGIVLGVVLILVVTFEFSTSIGSSDGSISVATSVAVPMSQTASPAP